MSGVDSSKPYSDEYFSRVEKTIEDIEKISKSCLDFSAEEIKDYFSKDLKEQKALFDKKKKEVEEGLSSAEEGITSGEAQIRQGEAELASAKAAAKAEFEKKYQELLAGDSQYAAGLKEYNEKYEEYVQNKAQFD